MANANLNIPSFSASCPENSFKKWWFWYMTLIRLSTPAADLKETNQRYDLANPIALEAWQDAIKWFYSQPNVLTTAADILEYWKEQTYYDQFEAHIPQANKEYEVFLLTFDDTPPVVAEVATA